MLNVYMVSSLLYVGLSSNGGTYDVALGQCLLFNSKCGINLIDKLVTPLLTDWSVVILSVANELKLARQSIISHCGEVKIRLKLSHPKQRVKLSTLLTSMYRCNRDRDSNLNKLTFSYPTSCCPIIEQAIPKTERGKVLVLLYVFCSVVHISVTVKLKVAEMQ